MTEGQSARLRRCLVQFGVRLQERPDHLGCPMSGQLGAQLRLLAPQALVICLISFSDSDQADLSWSAHGEYQVDFFSSQCSSCWLSSCAPSAAMLEGTREWSYSIPPLQDRGLASHHGASALSGFARGGVRRCGYCQMTQRLRREVDEASDIWSTELFR